MSDKGNKMTKCEDEIKYGLIYENDKINVWYTPIVEDMNGFVVYDKNNVIQEVYLPCSKLQ